MFRKGEFCLFSAVSGVVTKDGAPVAGATVERSYTWSGRSAESDTALTGDDGRFSFPKAVGSSFWARVLPHEPRIRQVITIRHNGAEYEGWLFDKDNYQENGETDGRPLRLVCRLEAEPKGEGGHYGVCTLE